MPSIDVPFWIGDREFTEDDIELIQTTVAQFRQLSRKELAWTLCENLSWKAPNGRLRVDACLKLLADFEQAGWLSPTPVHRNAAKGNRGKEMAGTPIETILAASLSEVSPVSVDPVSPSELGDWNVTMQAHHPLGYRRPIGAHQRYWIRVQTQKGRVVVGCLLFGPASKALRIRDQWIGWSPEQKTCYRMRIVNNNRFLILPQVHVPHLASHALALAARRIRADWQTRYGYEPVLLETFVEQEYLGTCYRAANWLHVGQTSGRGRQDTHHEYGASVKNLWMYPLVRDWRERLIAPLPHSVDPDFE
jgi:hypothetical protein